MKPENHFHLRVLPANMVWAMFDSFNLFQTIIINILCGSYSSYPIYIHNIHMRLK